MRALENCLVQLGHDRGRSARRRPRQFRIHPQHLPAATKDSVRHTNANQSEALAKNWFE
jgi:hypothetical protein